MKFLNLAFSVSIFTGISSLTCIGETITVTNTDDQGPGSLRQAVIDAAAASSPGATDIVFAASLDGKTIHLDGEIHITDPNPLTIQSTSSTPNGITIDADSTARIFRLTGAADTSMMNLQFTGGNGDASGLTFASLGGAILVDGSQLEVRRCTFYDNAATSGSAITCINASSLKLFQSTVVGKPTTTISSLLRFAGTGTMEIVRSTLTGQTAHSYKIISATNSTTITLHTSIVDGALRLRDSAVLNQTGTNLIGSLSSEAGSTVMGPVALSGDPLLGPLQDNGGPTLTMIPRHGSPAIDGAIDVVVGSTFSIDQRGAAPNLDGDHDGVATRDIGATEAISVRVENTNNQGLESLSEAIATANASNYSTAICFNPKTLSGRTISQASFTLNNPNAAIAIDGGDLFPSVTLDTGDGHLDIDSNTSIRGLTFANSTQHGAITSSQGAKLILQNCTFSNNIGFRGGALLVAGDAELTNCTFDGNSTVHLAPLSNDGGAIYHSGSGDLTLVHCTITGNRAQDEGGGVYMESGGTLNLINTVISGNRSNASSTLSDLKVGNLAISTLTGEGANVIGSLDLHSSTINNLPSPPISVDPQLRPLGHYGGPTQTRPPYPWSSLIDAATVLDLGYDQRGYPRLLDGDLDGNALPDIGAVELERLDAGLVAYYDFQETGDAGLANKAPGATAFNAIRGQSNNLFEAVEGVLSPSGPGFGGTAENRHSFSISDRSELLVGRALSLNSPSEEFIRVPLGTGAGELGNSFTISAWHALTPGHNNTNSRFFVFEAENNFDVSWGTPAQTPTGTGPLPELKYDAFVGQSAVPAIRDNILKTGPWHHVTHTFSSNGTDTTFSLYIDGVFIGSHVAPTSSINFSGLKFGNARGSNVRYWDGMIDEVGLWNRALSANEVATVYKTGLSKLPTSGLPASQTYSEWINLFFPGETDPAIIGYNADPDLDGRPNAIERILGSFPNFASDARFAPTGSLVSDPGNGIAAGDYFVFTYQQKQGIQPTDIVEFNPGLSNPWTEVSPGNNSNGVVQRVRISHFSGINLIQTYIPRNLLGARGFVRLKSVAP